MAFNKLWRPQPNKSIRFNKRTGKNRDFGWGCSDVKELNPNGSIKKIIELGDINPIKKKKGKKKTNLVLISDGRESERYNKWRRAVLSRDEYKCALCDSTTRIEAHHIIRWADNIRTRFNQRNGVSLCYECHQKNHNYNKEPFSEKVNDTLRKYIKYRYSKARLNKVPRETITLLQRESGRN